MNANETDDWYEHPLDTLRAAGPRICDDEALAVEIFQSLEPDELVAACDMYPGLVQRFELVIADFRDAGWAFDERALVTLGQLVAAHRRAACLHVLQEPGANPGP